MKTLRLTKPESAAYAAGERRFWRAIDLRKQGFDTAQPHEKATWCREDKGSWEWWGPQNKQGRALLYQWNATCPYGTPGDRIEMKRYVGCGVVTEATITATTVTQRDGKWGWLVEVGA